MSASTRIPFAIVGGGSWRAEFYLRIAHALPDRFQVTSLVENNAEKARAASAKWGVKAYPTIEEMQKADRPLFAVTTVPWNANPLLLRELAGRGLPVLTETPPAPDMAQLIALGDLIRAGAKINVSEQYPFQPLHAARIAMARSGRLGAVTQTQVSVAHGYHGMSLLRVLLGVRFENCSILGRRFKSRIVAGPGRDGPPKENKIVDAGQELAWLEFDGKLGVFDFTGDQYFSWIRSPRVLVRGEKGEINNDQACYLADYLTPIQCRFERRNAGEDGNLEGYYLKGIQAGSEWIYRNPFAPARLSDDEIGVATALEKMGAYMRGGPAFYTLAEACQDRYLDLLIQKAIETGQTVRSETQPWATWP